jgi:hypothetical protein
MTIRMPSPTDIAPVARAIDALGDPGRWAAGAVDLLRPLGFVVINGGDPGAPSGSHLLVALREIPTLQHFDPEAVTFYAATPEGKVDVATVDRALVAEFDVRTRRVLWGQLHIADRLRVENRFLSFGGEMRISQRDEALTILDLVSPGPIVRWGGHSQGTDWLAAAIGAFFGRLITAVDFRKGFEARLAATAPAVLYAAFLAREDPRRAAIVRQHGLQRTAARWIHAERVRVQDADGEAWTAGLELLADLNLG